MVSDVLTIIRFFRQARRELREAKSDLVRQNEETISLLQEAARRHMQTETSVDGMVSSLVVNSQSIFSLHFLFLPLSTNDGVVLTMGSFQVW